MDRQQVKVFIDDTDGVTVEIIAPRIGRVVELPPHLKVSENDILLLSHDPDESHEPPRMEAILYGRNSVVSEIDYESAENRNRIIAIAAVLRLDVKGIRAVNGIGTVRVVHPANIDIRAIAEVADLTPM